MSVSIIYVSMESEGTLFYDSYLYNRLYEVMEDINGCFGDNAWQLDYTLDIESEFSELEACSNLVDLYELLKKLEKLIDWDVDRDRILTNGILLTYKEVSVNGF